jgi:3-isopropylmalate/(R)-2-methylmalate dehydratase small subunit
MADVEGRVWKFGDNISADDGIIQYSQVPDLGTFDIPALKAMCFATLRPEFPQTVKSGDVVVGGRNFGHHSHPHAGVAMRESGLGGVFAESCDSAFIRKCLNVGLPVVICPGISAFAEDGDILSADLSLGRLRNLTRETSLTFRPYAPEMIEVWQAGGLAGALRRRGERTE